MPLPYLVLLNGPPRSGKNTAARAIIAELRRAATETAKAAGLDKPPAETFPSYADIVGAGHELKELTHAAYGMPGRAHDFYEKEKEVPTSDFNGGTPRGAYIAFSEKVMKPNFGPDVFGRLFIKRLERMGLLASGRVVVVPDAGFAEEWEPVIEAIGAHRMLLIRIDAARRGCTFDADTRNYISLPGGNSVWVENQRPGTIGRAVFQRDVQRVVSAWLANAIPSSAPAPAIVMDAPWVQVAAE